jgi:ElaA protein
MLRISVKSFDQLSTTELYEILQLRSEIFVAEQECAYQDVDGKDQKALHVIGFKKDKIVAYSRIFKAGDYLAQASIGRVVVKENERNHGYGYDIMNASIKAVEEELDERSIALSAQTYLKNFYNSLGFVEKGGEYLEDDIPHVMMVKF